MHKKLRIFVYIKVELQQQLLTKDYEIVILKDQIKQLQAEVERVSKNYIFNKKILFIIKMILFFHKEKRARRRNETFGIDSESHE
jgi:hypothetical protein